MRAAIICALIGLGLALGPPSPALARSYTVLVTSNGWHTDIAIMRGDLPEGRVPERADFAQAAYLQFGWGDADYYTTPDPGLGTTLGAAFPGPAVVHVAGLWGRPSEVFRETEEIALTLDAVQFARLVDYLHDSFDRGDAARVAATAKGVYDFSAFYPATGEFHIFNTCNTWTARGLAAAGVDVSASGVQSADDVMRQLRAK